MSCPVCGETRFRTSDGAVQVSPLLRGLCYLQKCPSKDSAISSHLDETADPIVSSFDLKKVTSPPCLYLIKLDVELDVVAPLGLDKLVGLLLRLALGVEVSVHGRHTAQCVHCSVFFPLDRTRSDIS